MEIASSEEYFVCGLKLKKQIIFPTVGLKAVLHLFRDELGLNSSDS